MVKLSFDFDNLLQLSTAVKECAENLLHYNNKQGFIALMESGYIGSFNTEGTVRCYLAMPLVSFHKKRQGIQIIMSDMLDTIQRQYVLTELHNAFQQLIADKKMDKIPQLIFPEKV